MFLQFPAFHETFGCINHYPVSKSELRSGPQEYKLLFEGAGSNPGDKTLEDRFFEHEVKHIQSHLTTDQAHTVCVCKYICTFLDGCCWI